MSRREIPSKLVESKINPLQIFEVAQAIKKNGGLNYGGLKSSAKELSTIGIDIEDEGKFNKYMAIGQNVKTSIHQSLGEISLSAPQDSYIGIDTFEISNQLIQDVSPESSFENSPFNVMMPYKNVDAISIQQEVMSSFYGWADGDNGVNGAINVVPLLESVSNQYKGYLTTEVSYLEGNDLIALREIGQSDTTKRAAIQKLNYGTLNLIQRQETGIELNRIEALIKGIYTYKTPNSPDPLKVSMQIPASNVTALVGGSLGTYTIATNTFARNTTLVPNVLIQMAETLTSIKNMGLVIDKIVMDNICFGAIFNSPAISSQTQYISMNSNNKVSDIRDNLFEITNIPALMGVKIEVDNRAIKVDSNKTGKSNTRPILWGKTVEAASFRALICTIPAKLNRVGDLGFFPNIYARTSEIAGGNVKNSGYGGGIVIANQDLSVSNIANQKIQIISASNSAPMIYLPNTVFTFDFNVNVV